MRKIFPFLRDNILFLCTLFLLMFIPLYPKIPILDVRNTWVYIRAEDFVVLAVLAFWTILLFKKKVTFKTPLTLPILVFWIIGAIATIHGVILIFPKTANIFPNVAFLAFLRHVEYMSLFFIAYSSMRDKKFLGAVVFVLALTLVLVVGYGIAQRYAGLPAYLTMNEEFAKGIPIRLSSLSRVPSTSAGHYDLAAYLVLILPILASLVFGFRNWFVKIALAASVILGFGLLFMTVSRVSFFVLLVALFVVLFFQKKRFAILTLPVVVFFAFLFLTLEPTLLSRFSNTIREVNVLVDAKTGEAIGHVNFIASSYLDDKIIKQKRIEDKEQLDKTLTGDTEDLPATPSSVLFFRSLPPEIPLVVATNISTGENLPQGTGYINLALSPVTKRLGNFFYELGRDPEATASEVLIFHGDFLVKRASAYDLSFTTRFQGEWPRALLAFERNILLGSGYGSVSLAVDNNYFRILGEIGLLGIAAFVTIFLAIGIYITRVLPNVDSRVAKSFVLGFAAGVLGLSLNALLIDVFEASKIAFLLWILTGVTLGLLSLYQKETVNLYKELKKAATSAYAVIIYLLLATFFVFSPMINNFFVGDDFTWFRWAADCSLINQADCPGMLSRISHYFTEAGGFFYRPGTKTYFLLMYSVFWLNQVVYHAVSILLHFAVLIVFFLLAKKILRSTVLSGLAAFLFLIMSGYSEIVFWISGTGHLFNALFALLALLFFIEWEDLPAGRQGKRKIVYYISSIIFISAGLLFHELGVVVPLLIIAYKLIHDPSFSMRKIIRLPYLLMFSPVIFYLFARFAAGSLWSGGDYSYNLLKFPLNVAGNIVGYLSLAMLGPTSLPFYQTLRSFSRENVALTAVSGLLIALVLVFFSRLIMRNVDKDERRVIIFGFIFFVISLLPFLGLGNIASRYSYLAILGLVLIIVIFVKKLYLYLEGYGRDIAIGGIATVIAIFALFHIIQVQQMHADWDGAGKKSKMFLVAIDALYSDYWSKEPVEFHFVNVPIRSGDAWVFPVGLEDALWFAFENRDLKIYIHQTLREALALAGDSPSKRVFVFQDDGSLREVTRPKNVVSSSP